MQAGALANQSTTQCGAGEPLDQKILDRCTGRLVTKTDSDGPRYLDAALDFRRPQISVPSTHLRGPNFQPPVHQCQYCTTKLSPVCGGVVIVRVFPEIL